MPLFGYIEIFKIILDGNFHSVKEITIITGLHYKLVRRNLFSIVQNPAFFTEIKKEPNQRNYLYRCLFLKTKNFVLPKTKQCCKCLKVSKNPKEDFYKNRHNYDGLGDTCKNCNLNAVKSYYRNNKEYINKQRRRRRRLSNR